MTTTTKTSETKARAERYAVTGDFSRMVYSRHVSRVAAERACNRLVREWGWSHPGSEPRVVKI